MVGLDCKMAGPLRKGYEEIVHDIEERPNQQICSARDCERKANTTTPYYEALAFVHYYLQLRRLADLCAAVVNI